MKTIWDWAPREAGPLWWRMLVLCLNIVVIVIFAAVLTGLLSLMVLVAVEIVRIISGITLPTTDVLLGMIFVLGIGVAIDLAEILRVLKQKK